MHYAIPLVPCTLKFLLWPSVRAAPLIWRLNPRVVATVDCL
jgi:hypothetical protein